MKVAILGYGKMGKTIEKILLEKGHQIVLKIGVDNIADCTMDNLKKADVAIEFSRPEAAIDNYQKCFDANVPVVSGTTGWLDQIEAIKNDIATKNGTLFYAPNFSIGVNIFFAINQKLAALMNKYPSYEVEMEEIHHTQKLDSPSGTAIRTADIIIDEVDGKEKWAEDLKKSENELLIKVKREENVKGTHKVTYLSDVDTIELNHIAHSRDGFAMGAVLAAEWIVQEKKKGFLEMKDMLGF
ncbi:MAG: 4-hydroxy-tetrahydrodipicolinate reductase [Chitinophagales bacterium]